MKFKMKILLLAVFIISLVSISPISANEINDSDETNDIVSDDVKEEVKIVEEEQQIQNDTSNAVSNVSNAEKNVEKSAMTSSVSTAGPIGYQAFLNAATNVKNFVNANGRLPNYVYVHDQNNEYWLSMPDFLSNSVQFICRYIFGGGSFDYHVVEIGHGNPTSPSGVSFNRQITSSEYINYAMNIADFMVTNGRAPNYVSTAYGNMQYQTAVYMFSLVLDFLGTNGRLPNYVTVNVAASDYLNKFLPVYNSTANVLVPNYDTFSSSTNVFADDYDVSNLDIELINLNSVFFNFIKLNTDSLPADSCSTLTTQ